MDGGAENDVGNVTAALLRSVAAVTAAGLSFSTGALARSFEFVFLYLCLLFMVALCNRADHYIFILFLLPFFFLA